jgi:hypothetical protein
MVKKYLALLAIAGIVAAVHSTDAAAQLNLRLGPLNLQLGGGGGGMVCLSDTDARAAQDAGQALPLSRLTQNLGNAGQLISQAFCRMDGRFVWVLSLRSGGAVTQQVYDAATGQRID